MKNSRTKLLTAFIASAFPAMCYAEDANAAAAADAGGEAAAAATEAARKRAAPSNFLPIVRGRLPLIFVHAIRFDAVIKAMSNKDQATKFATSVGKAFDIRKGRNFGYVTEDFKPTTDDVAQAEAWIKQIGEANAKSLVAVGDKALLQKVLDQYKERGLATAEEAAKFSAARTSTRAAKPAGTPAAALPAAGVGAGAASEGAQTASAKAADDLLG